MHKVFIGIPITLFNRISMTPKKKAETNAPIPSTRKSFFGLDVNFLEISKILPIMFVTAYWFTAKLIIIKTEQTYRKVVATQLLFCYRPPK